MFVLIYYQKKEDFKQKKNIIKTEKIILFDYLNTT